MVALLRILPLLLATISIYSSQVFGDSTPSPLDQTPEARAEHCAFIKEHALDGQLGAYLREKALAPEPEKIFEFAFFIQRHPLKLQITRNVITLYGPARLLSPIKCRAMSREYNSNEDYHFIKRYEFDHIGLHRDEGEIEIDHYHIAHNKCSSISRSELQRFTELMLQDGLITTEAQEEILFQFERYEYSNEMEE